MIMLLLIVLGLSMGSFINAFVWRLHEQANLKSAKNLNQKKTTRKKLSLDDLSIIHGRSMCPHCHHELGAKDLVPLISWLSLRGRCRYCQRPISWHYPVVELLTAVLFMLSYIYWPYRWTSGSIFQFSIWLMLLVGLIALALYDVYWMLLPDKVVYTLLAIMVLQVLVAAVLLHGGLAAVMTAGWGLLVLGGLFYGLFQISGGKWIGGGDVKLGFVLGLAVGGPLASLLLLFIASASGTVFALPLLITHKLERKNRLAFGPFLIFAAIVVRLFGNSLITWYKARLLL